MDARWAAIQMRLGLLLAVAILGLAGCAASPWSAAARAPASANVARLETPPSTAVPSPLPPSDPNRQAVEALVAEIAESDKLDEADREHLTQALLHTPPGMWRLFVQQYRATLAYRRQTTARPATESKVAADAPPYVPASAPAKPVGLETPPLPPEAACLAAKPLPAVRLAGQELLKSAVSAKVSAEVKPEPAPVQQVSYATNSPDDWRGKLRATIDALESEAEDMPKSPQECDLQARLRLLYLAAGQREEAMRAIATLPPAAQEFWSQELYGLSTWLEADRITDNARRAAEAKLHLSGAVQRLGEIAPLVVRNLTFISEVQSYGVYKPFESYEFTAGQDVLLYSEVENFKSEETARGYYTVLEGHYQILDARGQRVAEQALKTTEEHCRNQRRDFFLGYYLRIPKGLNPGKYTLQLTITDAKSQRVGQSTIDFTVKSP